MKLRYRGVNYEIAQTVPSRSMGITPITLIYRGNPYQSNQYQLTPQGIESQRSITNQSPQISSWKIPTVSPRLIYRGVAYIL